MIFADHYHNNPVMVCFCHLLVSNTPGGHIASSYSTFNNPPSGTDWRLHQTLPFSVGYFQLWHFFSLSEPIVNSLARRRWMLFYTLVKNPQLILLRKHHLSSALSEQKPTLPQSDTVLQAWAMTSQAQCNKATPQPNPEADAIPAEDWNMFNWFCSLSISLLFSFQFSRPRV